MKKIFPVILIILFSLNAQALFEVKDASDHSVFEIANDGIRIFNYPDTLMIISSAEIRANLDNSKGLSRSFSVSTNATGKGTLANVLEVGTQSTIMREGIGGDQYTNFSPDNIFIGLNSGINTTGVNNVFVGNQAGLTNGTGYKNVFVGPEAGYTNAGGDENVFMGFQAGRSNSSGNRNVYIGCEAGELNTSGSQNICIGDAAGKNNTAVLSVFIGTSAGWQNTNGISNMFIGNQAGANNTTGDFNNYFGWMSGVHANANHNTFIGTLSGWGVYEGDYNVYIGEYTGKYNDNGSGNVFLGNNVTISGSNKLAIDNTETSTPLIYGEFDNNYLKVNGKLHIENTTNVLGAPGIVIDTDGEDTDVPFRIRTTTTASGWTDSDTKFLVWGNGDVDVSGDLTFDKTVFSIKNSYDQAVIQGGWSGTWGDYTAMNSSYEWQGVKEPGSVITSNNFPLVVTSGNTGTPFSYTYMTVSNTGEVKIPTLYTTTSANSRKYLFVDTTGKLCVASKDGKDLSDNEDIKLLKEENNELKLEIDDLRSEIEEIKKILKK